MILYFVCYLFIMGLVSLVMIRKHMLLCLMSLEFIVLSLLCLILAYVLLFNYSYYLYLICMCFYVCEAVLGLSVLVSLIRFHGNDNLNSMFMW
uniref:NADH dehydrogenase subunit 4l n=1 Tax=Amritodus flavoscutatus TaxID=2479863 RepID=UPI002E79A4AF|nr:NADH dehydrogenase subunit 4l [Amritodus flavoscutatus]WQF70196.1 NADH dehydrogenase subunit 4l [Amritodus flavoscutatus]